MLNPQGDSAVTVATTDLCDAHPDIQVCDPVFVSCGGRADFHGSIATLKIFEDNALVRETLDSPGDGRVLVVDGGGSARCALVGGNLGVLAERNGWVGIVVYGYVRDRLELDACDVGIRALGFYPRKSEKGLHSAHRDRVVSFAGVRFTPGAWLYADADGIVVSDTRIHTD